MCTRNDDLEDVIGRTPESRRRDLVFLQNGALGPFLEKHGLQDNTQARSLLQQGCRLVRRLTRFATKHVLLDGLIPMGRAVSNRASIFKCLQVSFAAISGRPSHFSLTLQ